MNGRGSDDQERLRSLASRQFGMIRDPAVFGCWHVVLEAIEQGWLTPGSLDTLIATLDQGGGYGVEEYAMDVVDDRTVEVAFLDERYLCSRASMRSELSRLRAGLAGGELPPEAPPAPDPAPNSLAVPGSPDARSAPAPGSTDEAEAVLDALRRLAGTAAGVANPESSPEQQRVRAEAMATLADWDRATPGDETSGPIRRAMTFLDAEERADLAEAMRAFADYAEQPGRRTGERVDAVIRRLESTLGPLLQAGGWAEKQESERRIASEAEQSIARRIAEARDGAADGGRDDPAEAGRDFPGAGA